MCSLPPCGGGLGRGVVADAVNEMRGNRATIAEMGRSRSNKWPKGMFRVRSTPLPVPPPQGGREPSNKEPKKGGESCPLNVYALCKHGDAIGGDHAFSLRENKQRVDLCLD